MPSPQFSNAVRNVEGVPLDANIDSSVDINSYIKGDAFSVAAGGSATVNPAEIVQTIYLTTSASDATVEITTTGGSVFTMDVSGMVGTIEAYEVDSFTVSVNSTGDEVNGAWAGE